MRSVAKRSTLVAVALCAAVSLLAAVPALSSAAVAPAPAWRLEQSATPSTLIPGSSANRFGEGQGEVSNPKLRLTAVNVGGAEFGGATVRDVLPAGLAPAGEVAPSWVSFAPYPSVPAEENTKTQGPCTVGGTEGREITCELPFAVQPGIPVVVYIPLEVTATEPATLLNQITVEGPGGPTLSRTIPTEVGASSGPFGFPSAAEESVGGGAFDQAGGSPRAGAHPFIVELTSKVKTRALGSNQEALPVEALRDLSLSLPRGMVVNPLATPVKCSRVRFEEGEERCPASSQVGTITFDLLGGIESAITPLYNLEPEPGVPAELGFAITGATVTIRGGLSGDFRLTAGSSELLSRYPIDGVRAQLWGVPSDARHDAQRRSFPTSEHCLFGCASQADAAAFLTMPSACQASLEVRANATSWSGSSASRSASLQTVGGDTELVEGCGELQFSPTASVVPSTKAAGAPSGLAFELRVPQSNAPGGLAASTVKKVAVQLPPGMTVNPPAADGLGACSGAQIGLGSNSPAQCPAASRVGSAEISTPLLASPLKGSIYLAEQKSNPFGTLIALYLAAEGEGIVIKLPGRVDVDPQTGQVTTSFDNNPDLPFEALKVELNAGPRAALVSPPTCGANSARTEIVPWSGNAPVILSAPFDVNQGCSNGSFSPHLSAGSINPAAGQYTSFSLRVTQQDGEQNLSQLNATLPKGLLAKLAGVPLCSDAGASTGNCPPDSQVGQTTTGVGAGPLPLYLPQPGKGPTAIYLAGPYKGGPYSLVVKVPAQAGPFDLGTIVVRTVLNVNPFTAQVTAESDALPQILEGIPVSYRDVRVEVTQNEFVRNPTSCDPMQVLSRLASSTGSIASPTSPFQVAGCSSLAFKPTLKLALHGSTKRTGHPGLRAVLTYPERGRFANIRRAQVNLPQAEFLDQGNLNRTCTRPVLLQGKCPSSTIYGKAKAWTPLLGRPLEGPVFLVGGFGYKLPALVAELGGQLRVLLVGKVDTGNNRGIRNTFEAVPDAPVRRFVLELKGGKRYSLLENSENLCKKPQRAIVRFTGQNGAIEQLRPQISTQCGKSPKGAAGKHGGQK